MHVTSVAARALVGLAALVWLPLVGATPATAADSVAPVPDAPAPIDPQGRTDCIEPGEVFTPRPWPQSLWDLSAAWALSTGEGVTVAVLSSGVDGRQVQLAGQVDRGRSTLPETAAGAPGDQDCTGAGTALASLVAGQALPAVGLRGIAPDATILPMAVGETAWMDQDPESADVAARRVATAIRASVASGAEVVLVGGFLSNDAPELRDAVAAATAAGSLVVAPVRDTSGEFTTPSYPAAYPDVLGVTAIAQDRTAVPGTETGEAVDVAAPGANLAAAARGAGHTVVDGTSGAAALAAGAAALVLAREPDLEPDEVIARLRLTAGPVADEDEESIGAGLLDPARAVAERSAQDEDTAAVLEGLPPIDPQVVAAEEARRRRDALSLAGVGGVVALGGLAALGVATVRRARRRGWASTPHHAASAAPSAGADRQPRDLFRPAGDRTD